MAYTGYTPAHGKAHGKYMSKYIELRARVTPEQRDAIQQAATDASQSVNAYIVQAIAERMERDKAGG